MKKFCLYIALVTILMLFVVMIKLQKPTQTTYDCVLIVAGGLMVDIRYLVFGYWNKNLS